MTVPENFFQFEKLLVGLVNAGVDFATVGGVAVSLNGHVRATEDVDILLTIILKIFENCSIISRPGVRDLLVN